MPTSGKYTLLTLPDRVGGGRLPSVEVIDLRDRRRLLEEGAGPASTTAQ